MSAPKSILSTRDMKTGLNLLWSQGMKRGDSTGWPRLDEHYTVAPGQLTVVTGWPGSGKSEWVDALALNLVVHHDWRIALFSPENRPTELHVAKMLEKYVGKPFGRGPTERMTFEESQTAADVLGEMFAFLHPREVETPSAYDVLALASQWFDSRCESDVKRGLVIDPWNELDHLRPAALTETEYISQTLSLVRNWAREWNTHVWIVAHPAKQRREEGRLPIPRPDMIAGSQHWWNKADNCVTVVRDYENPDALVDVHVQKVRFKHIGRIGLVSLRYDRVTGRYHEPHAEGNVVYSLHERGAK